MSNAHKYCLKMDLLVRMDSLMSMKIFLDFVFFRRIYCYQSFLIAVVFLAPRLLFTSNSLFLSFFFDDAAHSAFFSPIFLFA